MVYRGSVHFFIKIRSKKNGLTNIRWYISGYFFDMVACKFIKKNKFTFPKIINLAICSKRNLPKL